METEQEQKPKMHPLDQAKKGKLIYGAILLICLTLIGFAVSQTKWMAPQKEHIAVLNLVGTISTNDGATFDEQYIFDALDEIEEDETCRGVLLYIDSPGGGVYETDEIYIKIKKFKERTGLPIYTAMGSYAASGAYYIASLSDMIYANRNTITGSIGIIMGPFINVEDFLESHDVHVTMIRSAENKGSGSFYLPFSEEQKEIYQSICDEMYQRFLNVVSQGRNMPIEQVRKLADGRPYTAHQALELKLIDRIATFDETLEQMTADLEVSPDDTVYYAYQAPESIMDSLMSVTKLQPSMSAEDYVVKQIEMATKHSPYMYYCEF